MDVSKHRFVSPQLESLIAQAVDFFCNTPLIPLPPHSEFAGVGVYALYYSGKCSFYAGIADRNKTRPGSLPIYAGKAVPRGWRQARLTTVSDKAELFCRLREHSRSIECCSSLERSAFQCRFMVMDGHAIDLISTVENALIRKFKPLWNSLVDGFGNHDPGSGRYEQACSEWDVLHPGRAWADRLNGQKPSQKFVLEKITRYNDALKKQNYGI